MDIEGLQRVVTQNVRVLMAIKRIDEQKQLAEMLKWETPKLSKTIRGHRRWALEDLVLLSAVFGVEVGLLLGDTAALVGALGPIRTGASGHTGVDTVGYRRSSDHRASRLGQVIHFPVPYQRVLQTCSAHAATPVTSMAAPQAGGSADAA